jgi:two-component system, chemotaxis family, chemotaxis protein CheY
MAKVLVVDDDELIRGLVVEVVSMAGHQIAHAVNGKDAVEKVKAGDYDLMIIDRNMPEMTGVQAVQMIRSVLKNVKLKIIMLTSASITKEVEEAYAAGANGYMVKPVNIDMLAKKVENILKAP